MTECWSCGAERGEEYFCGACGRLQPVARSATLFSALGLTAKMALSAPEVDKAFRERSRTFHPDRFGNASPIERRLALEHTAQLNEAQRTLKDPLLRGEYLLCLEGVHVGREDARTQDPALLMELLELQEAVASLRGRAELEAQERALGARREALLAVVRDYSDQRRGTQTEAVRALHELRYVRRLLETIEQRLEEMS